MGLTLDPTFSPLEGLPECRFLGCTPRASDGAALGWGRESGGHTLRRFSLEVGGEVGVLWWWLCCSGGLSLLPPQRAVVSLLHGLAHERCATTASSFLPSSPPEAALNVFP